jgi:hypothetical protein
LCAPSTEKGELCYKSIVVVSSLLLVPKIPSYSRQGFWRSLSHVVINTSHLWALGQRGATNASRQIMFLEKN